MGLRLVLLFLFTFFFPFPMVLVKPELNPGRLGLSPAAAARGRGQLRRHRAVWLCIDTGAAGAATPQNHPLSSPRDEPETTGATEVIDSDKPSGSPDEGEMPWGGTEHLVRSSRGKAGQLRWGADPDTLSLGGSIPSRHLFQLHPRRACTPAPVRAERASQRSSQPAPPDPSWLPQQGTSHHLKQVLKSGSGSCCLRVQSCGVREALPTCLRERLIAEFLSHPQSLLHHTIHKRFHTFYRKNF